MQSEEESRNILHSLKYDEVSNALQNNLREFMDLLNESEKVNDDKKRSPREKEDGIPERNKSQLCMKKDKFIERNIQLAQCGKGVLSVTDKEKLRIQNLLMEDDKDERLNNDSEESLKAIFLMNYKNFYGFDDDSKFLLKCIDEQLKKFPRQMHLNQSQILQRSVEEKTELNEDNGNVNDNSDSADINLFKRRSKNQRKSLKEIEKLLSDLNSVTAKEINPLPNTKMELLIRQARQNIEDTVAKVIEKDAKITT